MEQDANEASATRSRSTKFDIPDLTHIEKMGGPPTIFPTPAGAKENKESSKAGKYANSPLLFRRVFGHGEAVPKPQLEIQSEALIDFLKQLPNPNSCLPVHESPMIICEPYPGLFYFRDEIKKAATSAEHEEIWRDLEHLLQFEEEYMGQAMCKIESFLASGEIDFAHLWVLFKPGQPVVRQALDTHGDPYYWLGFVSQFSYSKTSEGSIGFVQVLSTAVRQQRVGVKLDTVTIPGFTGIIKIPDLHIVPLSHHPKSEDIRAKALVRSSLYLDILSKNPLAQMVYGGPIWIPPRRKTTGVDNFFQCSGMSRQEQTSGCGFFDPPTCNVSIFTPTKSLHKSRGRMS